MNRKLLASAICAALVLPAFANVAFAQETDATDKTEATDLDKVVVTGSLIPRSQLETASPVITISAEQIQKQGFRNVYDALRSSSMSTGAVQDSQFTNSFTPGANTVSLLGLDPSFTLVLMNGRPLADYPLLYNSTSNFVDLATIPTFLVERIDILPGNQSAIYGSAAIAGVVNIILKKDLNGVMASVRTGKYTDGGGDSQKFTLAGGSTHGDLSLMYGIEFANQNPIFGSDRSYTDSTLDAPTAAGRDAQRNRVAIDAFTGRYVDPGQATCDAITNLFDGDMDYRTRAAGKYCGSTEAVGNTTFMNGREDYNGYLSATYRFNDNAELYGDFLYNVNKVTYRVGGTSFWTIGVGMDPYVYDLDSGHLVSTLQHIYAPEEIGNLADGKGIQHSYVANLGLRGTFGDSKWDYDVYLHRSAYESKFKARRALTDQVNAFFLGPQDGTDPYGYGYGAYHISQTGHFWGAVTPEQFLSYTDLNVTRSETYSQNATATVTNANLFELPAGAVGFAGVIEVGNQMWDNPVDPRVTAGDFWGTGGTSGYGKRNRQAAGFEINVPIFSMLTANGSARYDRYSAAGHAEDKVTYKLGLEFRPIDTLLFRGNYATGFRAPDMGYIFSGGSSFFTSVEDVYNCRLTDGDDYASTAAGCSAPNDSVQIQGGATANKDLEYITSKSYGFGVVWSPNTNINVKVDYYHIDIDNQVSNYSLATILEKEAECRIGTKIDGTPVDVNSADCAQVLSQVDRNPLTAPVGAGDLNRVVTSPINIAREMVSGITASASYTLDTDRFGSFTIAGDYNKTLKHEYQQFPTDDVLDLTSPNNSNEFGDIGSLTLGWENDSWAATVRGTRFSGASSGGVDSTGNFFDVDPWIVYNASIQYTYDDDLTFTLSGNNITNKRPPRDNTQTAYPYYNVFNYNSFGRLLMLEVAYKFE